MGKLTNPQYSHLFPEEDWIQLLSHNTRQILRILEASFESTEFDGYIDPVECMSQIKPDARLLQCQWALAKQLLEDQNYDVQAKLNALIIVRCCACGTQLKLMLTL